MIKVLGFIATVLSCTHSTSVSFAAERIHMATLANLQGSAAQVQLMTPDGMRMVPSIGNRIENGTRIKTGSNVILQVLYDDGSQTMIGPDSELLINSSQPNAVESTLFQGKIRSKVSKPLPSFNPNVLTKPKYIIHTGAMTLGVRGTDFTVNTPPNHDRIQVELLDGVVDLWKSPTEKFENPDRRLKPGDGVEVRTTGDEVVYRISPQTYGKMDTAGPNNQTSTSKVKSNQGRLFDLYDTLMNGFKALIDWIKAKL